MLICFEVLLVGWWISYGLWISDFVKLLFYVKLLAGLVGGLHGLYWMVTVVG